MLKIRFHDPLSFHAMLYTFRALESFGRSAMAHHTPEPSAPIECVGFLLIPGFSLMSYSAAVEPLRAANVLAGKSLYQWFHVTPDDNPAAASNGAAIVPDCKLGSRHPDLDLMIVCAAGNPASFKDARTLKWLRELAREGVTIGGVSGAPYILARAGLLTGRRCTIHWEHAAAFQEAFPHIELTRSLFELDGDRFTCSGGIAGLDMMISLITRDQGYALGAAVGDWFLHTHLREGAGPQRMDLKLRLGVGDEALLRALKAMETHLEAPLSRRHLADIACVSVRQLERKFRRQLGRGMHQHYLGLRLLRARQLLKQSQLSVLQIGVATGFASPSQFSRTFKRVIGTAPQEFRTRRVDQNRAPEAWAS